MWFLNTGGLVQARYLSTDFQEGTCFGSPKFEREKRMTHREPLARGGRVLGLPMAKIVYEECTECEKEN